MFHAYLYLTFGWGFRCARNLVLQANPVEGVPGGGVGKDDFVAQVQALEDLNAVDGGAAEADAGPVRFSGDGIDAE